MISVCGIVLTAAYMLWTLQRVFLGKPNDKWMNLPDISARELVALVPLAVVVIVLGIYPSLMLDMMTSTMNHLVDIVLRAPNAVALVP
jgi:NADH-quinone oxidoreductase subunit M